MDTNDVGFLTLRDF
jgi:Ca2+-binding EF-hand superfamily protein